MAPLTQDRSIPARSGDTREPPVKADTVIFGGAMVAIDGESLAVPASADDTLKVIGRAERRADNSGGVDGGIRVRVGVGIYRYDNSDGADEISLSDVGATAYAVDDQTVALTDDEGARPAAGTIFDVDELGVWVRFA